MDTNTNRYWAILNGMRVGPVDFQELTGLGINPDTPVWRAGLADWVEAASLPELAEMFVVNIPPVPDAPPTYTGSWQQPNYTADVPRPCEPMPSTYLVWSILATLFCCIPTGIVAIIYSSKVSSRYTAGDYDGARRASDSAALWILVTVVLGLVALPFQIILSLF